MKKCKSGYYYCNTDKKCKPIPKGYRIGYGGYLRNENDDDSNGKKKNGNGNGNGGNGNGGNGNGGNGGGNGGGMSEGSLHKWFKGSKSKDGKPGWVNVKTGGTCASDEPGEGTPKCVSSSKRASMSKSERESASRRKKAADPGQQSKTGAAKPTYVSTDKPKKKMKEEIEITESDKKGKGSGTKDACYTKVKSRYSVWPSAYASGALVKCRKVGAANWGNKSEAYEVTNADKKGNTPAYQGLKAGKKNKLTGKPLYKAAPHMKEGVVEIQNSDGQTFAGVIDIVGPANMKTVTNENGVWQGTEQISEMKRDEYGDPIGGPKISKKQLKKNLAANTPDEKHTTTTSEAMNPAQQAAIAISKKQRIMDLMVASKKKKNVKEENLDEKCWKGYKKKGMKTMFGKRYPNCVKKKIGESISDWRDDINFESFEIDKVAHKAAQKKSKMRNLAINNDNPNEKAAAEKKAGGPKLVGEGAAWTKKSGKSASGGLNEKGRKSYEKENPGSDLKAPSKKVGNKRRASFCARMKGMKKKLTSAKTARDPDSRINKSLRAWNC